MPRLASRERLSFSRLPEVLELPDLIAVQRESFDHFVQEGIAEVLADISPIEDFTGTLKLELADHVFDPPKHSEDECRERDMTFARPLFVTARFMNAATGEIKEQTVFMGDFPMMTDRGTFIINGTERIVVSQLVRSPGVYFGINPDKTSPEKDIVDAKIIPGRGAWLEFEVDKKDIVYVRIDRKRKQPVTILLKALGFGESPEELSSLILDANGQPYQSMLNTIEKDNTEDADAAFIDIYRKLRPGEPPTPDSARQLLENLFFNPKRYDMAKVGRHKVGKKLVDEYKKLPLSKYDLKAPNADPEKGAVDYQLSRADILATVSYLVKLHSNDQPDDYFADDIDHFGNRRVRSVGELIQNQVRVGLSRMERVVRERMTTQDVEAITPQTLINIRPVVAAIKEFFGSSQLSQFMDQTNPLAGLTHKRRLSALGPGGLSRERAGFEVRDVHPSHYGRMCPIETPEGPNIGLIGYLSTYARINRFGFIETPYRKVEGGRATRKIEYLAADDEDRYVIAQANAAVDNEGNFQDVKVLVRARRGEVAYVDPHEVDYMDVSPKQIVSVATALIPFLEHDDANRALMGANMQRQAVPVLRPTAPFIGTGVEARAARDAGDIVLAEGDGEVTDVSGESIVVEYAPNGTRKGKVTYRLSKFRRSNQGTCINQKPLVDVGDPVKEGQVLADGPSTHQGELALGKNLLVAFMPWKGQNFEDAIVISERLVKDDVLTSIHIEEHEIDARDTKLGAEEITRDIPNLSEDILKDLDEDGIIRIGAEVGPGDILVGKVTPKGETELTPEERLLRAIFGEKAREVRDTSLKVPHGENGKVIDVRKFSHEEGHELPPGVNQLVRVYVGQKRKISEGDKLAGRHGNKGVISKILPVEDMPYLADGTPVDIVLNPLGVPSRMNVGQVLEAHLGYAARFGWGDKRLAPKNERKTRTITEPSVWVSSPVFDGAHWDETDQGGIEGTIQSLFENLHPDGADGTRLVGIDGKASLYDGRTGEAFDRPVTVGFVYILKLAHLVDDKIHARSTGPYSMITQQPLGGKAQFGGQRFGEMEVWALEAYGAAYALQEILTIKSDDVLGRVKVYEAIVKGENIPEPGIPESFKVLIKEMQALCLNVRVMDEEGQEVEIRELDEDAFRTTEALGIDLSRPERGTDEEDAARARKGEVLNMHDVNESARLSIALATAEQIRMWSNGEVKKPETINYRTLKPEKDGLFCEKIFGPTKDWECYCGKYKRVRFKGIICERCGVEVTRSKVRRERMGHIELAAPVTHIWYFKGVPSRLGYLLDIAPKSLEKVIYFAAHLITWVDADKRHNDQAELEADIKAEVGDLEKERDVRLAARDQEYEKELAELEKASASGNARKADVERAEKARAKDIEEIRERVDAELLHLKTVWDTFVKLAPKQLVDDERVWRELRDRYDEYFTGNMGAEAVKDLISHLDMPQEEIDLKEVAATAKGQRKAKAIKRLRVISAFNRLDQDGRPINSPMGMVLDAVPVIPPDLRPMVQLDGGRFATSDLNDLYRRVINRNNRLKRLLDLGAPEIIINNEKRMLQEAVDALFDNGRRGRPVTGPGNRALKSLSDMLKGKQGRFRQNLLGKRVDYSGRSVIVVGPMLKLQQCGLPKQMALELFKPFVMKRLVDLEFAQNIKSAKRMVERARPQVWDVLEEVIKEHPVFLNRAPTLHRLGIQAFEPVLVEGKAIQIHPLVCSAFNADFDGDQMAVHLPLSSEAQAEARLLMLSAHNILSPAHGRPIAVPSQDMIIGCYYLTELVEDAAGQGRTFSSLDEAVLAHDERLIPGGEEGSGVSLHALIKVRMPAGRFPVEQFPERDDKNPERIVLRRFDGDGNGNGDGSVLVESTLGRFLFNESFPPDFPFKGASAVGGFKRSAGGGLKKRELTAIVGDLVDDYPRALVARSLDNLKDLGFEFSTRAGLTISMADVKTPVTKGALLEHFEGEADKIEQQYDRGIITDDERRQKEIEIWTDATDRVREAMEQEMSSEQFNPIDMMVGSGARGNIVQVRQIAGMRGLVANPRGEIIPRPVKSSFREGLSVLEYFISTHGARKGLADTALRTADSGYLTRRLVDVAQELIVRDEDCESTRGIWVEHVMPDVDMRLLDTRLLGRSLAEDIKLEDGSTLPRNTEIREDHVEILKADKGVERIRVRSPLTCDSISGVCARCYGTMLATGKPVDLGEAVGIIAAQSIGEPGTQLTMRTFHTGGVAGEDITHGLPRVVELFEARTPKGAAVLSEASGVVRIGENEKGERVLTVVTNDGEEEEHVVSRRAHLYDGANGPKIKDGVEVSAGDQLTGDDGTPLDPKKILEVKGIRETQQYLSDETQKVYREQGVSIHDKHVEVIVRQMLRRVAVSEPGESAFLPGQKVDSRLYAETNRRLVEEGKQPAEGRPELMGITKASLATDSWLSAASFQETTRVLTEAAIEGRTDGLFGLKENVIIGKLIPAGTGMPVYREIATEAPDYEPLPFYSTDIDAEAMAAYLRDSISSTPAEEAAEGHALLTAVEDPPLEGTGTEE